MADTTLADPPPLCHVSSHSSLHCCRYSEEHRLRHPSQGVRSNHLGWWKHWCYPDLYQVWVSLGILSLSCLWISLLVLPTVNMSLAQLAILKEVSVQNASCWCWCPSPGALSWGGQEPRLCAGYGPTAPSQGSHPLFPPNVCLEASPCRAVPWGTKTLAAACLLQRISWCFQETESKLKCSSTLKED